MPTFTSISPYLPYQDGDAAAEWLTRVLGFGPSRCVRDADGRWSEGTVWAGEVHVEIHGGDAAHAIGGHGGLMILGVDDVDAQYRRIKDAGVEIDPPRDESYGPRTCHVTDPWGYRWYFWQGDAVYD